MSESTAVAYFTVVELEDCKVGDGITDDPTNPEDGRCVEGANRVSISEVSAGGIASETKCKTKCSEEAKKKLDE
jgi:hypothetical protein